MTNVVRDERLGCRTSDRSCVCRATHRPLRVRLVPAGSCFRPSAEIYLQSWVSRSPRSGAWSTDEQESLWRMPVIRRQQRSSSPSSRPPSARWPARGTAGNIVHNEYSIHLKVIAYRRRPARLDNLSTACHRAGEAEIDAFGRTRATCRMMRLHECG